MPEIAIYNRPKPNAFATGMNKDKALVVVRRGLLQAMTHDEVESVFVHEICHVSNGNMVILALIQGVVNTFVIVLSGVVVHLVDRTVFKTEHGHGPAFWITSIIVELILVVLASILVRWFSPQGEYCADASSTQLVWSHKVIAALECLSGSSSAPLPEQLNVVGISGNKSSISRLFITNPPLEVRIKSLKNS
jgi:heat shock protein HtpX